MADSPISSLNSVDNIEPDDLFVLEHTSNGQRQACKLRGEQVTQYVSRNVVAYNGSIVPSNAAGGANYDPDTKTLTLVLPHGPGFETVVPGASRAATEEEVATLEGTVTTYDLMSEEVRLTNPDSTIPSQKVGEIQVYNGRNGTGLINSVMNIGPTAGTTNVPAEKLFNLIYPVGSVFTSAVYFSPAAQFSGTWVRLMNRFLYASGPGAANGAGNAVGTLDGSAKKTISRANLPPQNLRLGQCAHTTAANPDVDLSASNFENVNTFGVYSMSPGTATAWVVPSLNKATAGGYSRPDKDIITEKLGSGTAMDIMPPYRTYHAWERVSTTHVFGSDAAPNYFTPGAYITTNTSTINMLSFNVAYDYMSTIVIAVSPGDKFSLTGTGASYGRLWAFVGADGTTRKRFSTAGVTETELKLTAKADEAFLIVNVNTEHSYNLVGLAPE